MKGRGRNAAIDAYMGLRSLPRPSGSGIYGGLSRRPAGPGDVWARLRDIVDPATLRPKLAGDIEVKEFHLRWGNDYAVIGNPRDLIHYQLSPAELAVVRLMDGDPHAQGDRGGAVPGLRRAGTLRRGGPGSDAGQGQLPGTTLRGRGQRRGAGP